MSRTQDRAYDTILKLGEKFSVEDISQMRVVNAGADNALVTTIDGTLKLVPTSEFGSNGLTLPEPPLGENDALTVDPAGVVKWGGQISAGEF